MKNKYLLLLGIAALAALGAGPARAQSRQERLKEHVYYLASDSLRGRKAGTPDATKAAEYIIGEYEQAGLKPLFREGWYDRFTRKGDHESDFKNVVGLIEGTDPALRGECIVIGAHYDHLGVRQDKIYNGADDNASGSAAVIEIARALAGAQPRRSIIIAAFDAEEIGLVGSSHLAERLDTLGFHIKLMMSVDMVGWLKAGKALKLEGVATIKDGKKILKAQAGSLTLDLKRFERSVFTATDTEGFATMGIPTLAVTTGLKSPYHKPEDDAELIDYEGLDLVTGYLTDLTTDLATRDHFASSGQVAPKHKSLSDTGLDFALVAGYSRDHISFPGAAFEGKDRLSWNAGIEAQLSLGYFGVVTQVLYDRFNAFYPDVDDLFGSSHRFRQDELCIPLSLVLRTPRSNSGSAYIGGGAYYARVLSWGWDGQKYSSWNIYPGGLVLEGEAPPTPIIPTHGFKPVDNQWGFNYTVGVRIANIQFGFLYLWQKGRLFEGSGAPDARRNSAMFQLKYIF